MLFQCDNTGVGAAVQKGAAKDDLVMHLLHCLWFFMAHYDTTITSDMQGLVWGEPELVHEYDFDVENIIAKNTKFEVCNIRNTTS